MPKWMVHLLFIDLPVLSIRELWLSQWQKWNKVTVYPTKISAVFSLSEETL